MLLRYCTLVFFFKQKTAYVMRISDWSSDVCSSDLTITAGNASQLSDGASACILMSSSLAEKRNIEALGAFRGFSVAGNSPEEMGIAPVFAIPRFLSRHGLPVDDIARSEEHTSELQSLMRISYAVFRLQQTTTTTK